MAREAIRRSVERVTIDGYTIDAVLSEDHTFEAEVTEYPVEIGSNIADHVRVKPKMLSLEGVVSDTPFGAVSDLRNEEWPSDEAFNRLIDMLEGRQPVIITTSTRTYKNMVLQSLQVPRSKDTGEALRFRAAFKEVITVANERTVVKVAVPRASKKKDRGTKPTTPSEPSKPSSDRARSILKMLFGDTFVGVF